MKHFPFKNKTKQDLENQLQKYPQSNFGYTRKHDIHTGIDIYADPNQEVFAIEDGVVVSMDIFTGAEVDSPWWNTTQSIVIKSNSGYILYGEIKINPNLILGSMIKSGDLIGQVLPVLKKDKGINPVNMLHLELYKQGPFSLIWNLNEKKSENILNPMILF